MFDRFGLVVVVIFGEGGYYRVVTNFSEKIRAWGMQFARYAIEKYGKARFFGLKKNLVAYVGRYLMLAECDGNKKNIAKLLRKIDEILSAVRTRDPEEIGEILARTVRAELLL